MRDRLENVAPLVPAVSTFRRTGRDEVMPCSTVKPELTRLAGSGSELEGAVVERVFCSASNGMDAETVLPDKHLLVAHVGRPVDLEWRLDQNLHVGQLRPGDLVLHPAGLPTTPRWNHDREAILLAIDPGIVKCAGAWLGRSANIQLTPRFQLIDPLLRALVEQVMAENETGSPPNIPYVERMVDMVAAHLVARYSAQPAADPKSPRCLGRTQLKRVLDYIDETLPDKPRVSDLASVAGISPSYFAMLFRDSMGMPAYSYITRRRIDRAITLLQRPGLSIAEIAALCDFSDQSHLTRVMRRQLGVTPAKVRSR